MATLRSLAASVYRASLGGHPWFPKKSEIIDLFGEVDDQIASVAGAGAAFADAADDIGAGSGVVVFEGGEFSVAGRDEFRGEPGGSQDAVGYFTQLGSLPIATGIDLVRSSGYYAPGDGGQADYVYDAAVDAAYVTANPLTSFRTANGRGFRLSATTMRVEFFGGIKGASDAAGLANAAAFLAMFEYMRVQHNAGSSVSAQVGQGPYRITYARGQANTDPFVNRTAKAFYVIKVGDGTAGTWKPLHTAGTEDADSHSAHLTIDWQNTVIHADGDENSWFWSGNAVVVGDVTSGIPTIDFRGSLFLRPWDKTKVTHGMSLSTLMGGAEKLETSYFENGVGLHIGGCDRVLIGMQIAMHNRRGLVVGKPNAVLWYEDGASPNEVTILNSVLMYNGKNTPLANLQTEGFLENWQSENLRVLSASWKSNYTGHLLVSALNPIFQSIYYENNMRNRPQGLLTGYSALSGGSGYVNGETVAIRRPDGANSFSSATATVSGGVITGLSNYLTTYGAAFGFKTGVAGCTITGLTSGAANATLTSVVAGAQEAQGLYTDCIIDPRLAPTSPTNTPSPLVNVVFRNCRSAFDGFLIRASSSRQIFGLTFDDHNIHDPGRSGFLKYVEAERTYVTRLSINRGSLNGYSETAGYPDQHNVDPTTLQWISKSNGRRLPIEQITPRGNRRGFQALHRGVVFDVESPVVLNVTGDGTAVKVPFSVSYRNDDDTFDLANNAFVAPVNGRYSVSCLTAIAATGSTHTAGRIVLYKNGAYFRALLDWNPYATRSVGTFTGAPGDATQIHPGSLNLDLTAGDALSVYVVVWGGSKSVHLNKCYFNGHLLS